MISAGEICKDQTILTTNLMEENMLEYYKCVMCSLPHSASESCSPSCPHWHWKSRHWLGHFQVLLITHTGMKVKGHVLDSHWPLQIAQHWTTCCWKSWGRSRLQNLLPKRSFHHSPTWLSNRAAGSTKEPEKRQQDSWIHHHHQWRHKKMKVYTLILIIIFATAVHKLLTQ